MVSAYLVREGPLAQEACDAKSNEITAIPRLLDRIHLEEAVVTMPPAASGPSYRPCGKPMEPAGRQGNQGTLHRQVKAAFDEAERGGFIPRTAARPSSQRRPPRAAHLHRAGRSRPLSRTKRGPACAA